MSEDNLGIAKVQPLDHRDLDGGVIKIGIISDSFDALSGAVVDVENGELPGSRNPTGRNLPVEVLSDLDKGAEFATDEGRALAQVVHDVAPGSELLFHTFLGKDENNFVANGDSFAKAVNALREMDVDIILNDASLLDPLVEDSVSAQAVDNAVNDGIVYLSAAGNNGSIAYESEFRKGESFLLDGASFETHDFDPGASIDSFQKIEVSNDGTLLRPIFSAYSSSDDSNVSSSTAMLLLDSPEMPSESNIKAVAISLSETTLGASLNALSYSAQKGDDLYYAIIRDAREKPAEDQQIRWVSTANGSDRNVEYEYVDPLLGMPTVFGQSNAEGAITVGSANDDGTAYDSFASRGSVPILFDKDGKPLPEPIVRQKPDIIGPDNITTAFPEGSQFNPFIGTSAAVAHVAGVVALMEQAAGGPDVLSPETIKTILGATSSPVKPAPGLPDSTGFVQKDLAILGAQAAGQLASICPDLLV
jgi:hypothetical protein